MADGMTAEVHGLEEAIHAVDEIHPRITKYVVGKSLTIGARVFVNGMRGLVPARWPKLKKSIKLKRLRANKSGRSYLIGPSWPDGALINLVEFGTAGRREPGAPGESVGEPYDIQAYGGPVTVKHPGIAPTPIVRPAMLAFGDKATDTTAKAAIRFSEDELEKLGRETIPPAAKKRADF